MCAIQLERPSDYVSEAKEVKIKFLLFLTIYTILILLESGYKNLYDEQVYKLLIQKIKFNFLRREDELGFNNTLNSTYQ